MHERAVPCCRCLAALAAWKDGAAPLCRDGNSTVTEKCSGCRDLGKPCIAPSGLLKARAIVLRAAIAAHPGVRPVSRCQGSPGRRPQAAVKQAYQARRDAAARQAREKAEQQESSAAAAAEKTAAAVGKIVMELQQLRGEVAGLAEVYRKTHEATVEAPHHNGLRRPRIIRSGRPES
ncbi:hypothetical protein DL770_010422 [Monosporascus sp. CRB-9-2]|nr:hypothetical protein DL770_010422 [Monosporascus sp. CRB-9-2]